MTSDLLETLAEFSSLLSGINPNLPFHEQYLARLEELEGQIRALEDKTSRREISDPEKYKELSELLNRYDEMRAATETAFQPSLEGKPPKVQRRLQRQRDEMLRNVEDLRLQTFKEREGLITPPDANDLITLGECRAGLERLRHLYSQLYPLIDVLSAATVRQTGVSSLPVDLSGLADRVSDQVVGKIDLPLLRQEIESRLDKTDQFIDSAVNQAELLGRSSVEHEVVVTHQYQLDLWLAGVLPLMNVVVFWFCLSLLSQRLTAVLLSGATVLALILAIAFNVGVVWVISRLRVSDNVKTHQRTIFPAVRQSRRPQPP